MVSVTQTWVLKQISALWHILFVQVALCQILTGVIEGHFLLDNTAALFHLSVQLCLAPPQLLLTAEREGPKKSLINGIYSPRGQLIYNVMEQQPFIPFILIQYGKHTHSIQNVYF